jgi:hypothetical protein
MAFEPTAGAPPPSTCDLTTLACHSASREGSLTYEKTSSGGRATSMLETIGAMLLLDLRQLDHHLAPRVQLRKPIPDFSFAA